MFWFSRYDLHTFSKKSSSLGMGRTFRHVNSHRPSLRRTSCT